MRLDRVTFDEFIRVSSEVDFKRLRDLTDTPEESTPMEAALAARSSTNGRSEMCCYYTSLWRSDTLYDELIVPNEVSNVDLRLNFLPQSISQDYLKERSKFFYGCEEGFTSLPYMPFAAMSEWILVTIGELELTLIDPNPDLTDRASVIKCYFDEKCDTIPFEDLKKTTKTKVGVLHGFKLRPGSLIIVPPGWFCVRKAIKGTYYWTGEFLNFRQIRTHLTQFELDTAEEDLSMDHQISSKRDLEIRKAVWFMKTQLIRSCNAHIRKTMPESDIIFLNSCIKRWSSTSRMNPVSDPLVVEFIRYVKETEPEYSGVLKGSGRKRPRNEEDKTSKSNKVKQLELPPNHS